MRSCIFGSGNGLRLSRLFNSRKSDIKRTVPFFFGMIKLGAPHSESLHFSSTPILQRRSISLRVVASRDRGIGYGRAWYGTASGFSSSLTGVVFHSPSQPSNIFSYLRSTANNFDCSSVVRCSLSATTLAKSAFSYLASRIRVIRVVTSFSMSVVKISSQ